MKNAVILEYIESLREGDPGGKIRNGAPEAELDNAREDGEILARSRCAEDLEFLLKVFRD